MAGSFGFASSPRFTTELELAGGRGIGREEVEEGGISFLLLRPSILFLDADPAADDN